VGHDRPHGCESVSRRTDRSGDPDLLGLGLRGPVAGVMLTKGLPDGNVRENSRIEGNLQP
jgi:hypothetical protein